jgi:hypothetical protein
MRKLLFVVLLLGLIALAYTSCKREFTCTCIIQYFDKDTFVFSNNYGNVNKGEAEKACAAAEDAYLSLEGYDGECTLD